MKKTLIGFVALSALSTASAANYAGVSFGTSGTGSAFGGNFSVHYQQDRTATTAMRYSLDLAATSLSFNAFTIGGSVDYLANIPNTAQGALTPYYGFGLGATIGMGGGVGGIGLYPHGILGAKYNVSAPLSVFGELNAGPAIGFATSGGSSAAAFGFGWGARLGINYMLNF